MKKIFMFITIALILTFCGCQPTPSEPVVINKGGDIFASAIAQTASPSADYKLPEIWKDTFQREGSKLVVDVDANITVPEVNTYPAVKIDSNRFTQQQADRIIEVLFQGKTPYNKGVRTKSELEDQLIQAKADLAKKKTDPTNNEGSIGDLEYEISTLEEEIPNAPETKDKASTQFQIDEYAEIRLDLSADLGKKQNATLTIMNMDSNKSLNCYVQFINTDSNGTYNSFEDHQLSDSILNLKISKDDAISRAKKLLDGIGITDMDLANVIPGIISGAEGSDVSNNPQCYMVYFTRTVSGIPTTFAERVGDEGKGPIPIGQSGDSSLEYKPFWPKEQILVCVDDSGITEFEWQSPVSIIDNISNNVALLQFEKIEKAFEEQMFVRYAIGNETGDDNMLEKRTYHIDKITLGLARIDIKDNLNEYMLIPVWDFFGSIQDEYDMDSVAARMKELDPKNADIHIEYYQERNGIPVSNGSKSFVTINAVDGSLVN